MTEGRKAGWASKIEPDSLLNSKSGSPTAFIFPPTFKRNESNLTCLATFQPTAWLGTFTCIHEHALALLPP